MAPSWFGFMQMPCAAQTMGAAPKFRITGVYKA
jgi:hypothetical protein